MAEDLVIGICHTCTGVVMQKYTSLAQKNVTEGRCHQCWIDVENRLEIVGFRFKE
jgi:hypothetical protein